jgi:pimeloyl-ACP methyl ester carboxylesterase
MQIFKMILIFGTLVFMQNAIAQNHQQNNPQWSDTTFYQSEKTDFVRIPSSITDSVKFAIAVYKPEKPSPVLLLAHGWHGKVKRPLPGAENPYPGFLSIQVDMRGRQYSTGEQDCNGLELYDYYDAWLYAKDHYSEYLSEPDQVYFLGGSGGGGNGYALVGKFPDLFVSAVIQCGISDYAHWFEHDTLGEFRDEMIPWIGTTPEKDPEAFASRSGIITAANVLTPLFIVHGETDSRVPVWHARTYVNKARSLDKEIEYLELQNVGTRSHWGNITETQQARKDSLVQRGLSFYQDPPMLPKSGELIVAGYVVTKHFSVFLDSIDQVGKIRYNLEHKDITFLKQSGRIVWFR